MRRLAAFAGSFSLGVFLAQYVLRGGWILAGAGLALALGFLSKLLPWEWRRRGVILCAALALGLGWSWLYARQIQRPAQEMAGRRSDFTATLCGYAEETDFGARAEVRVEGVPGKAVLYAGEELLDLAPGQTVAGQARFNDAARVRDEDITAFTSKGVFLLAYARGNLEAGEGTRNSPRWLPARMGRAMRERIQVLFPGDAAGFLTAVLTGDRGGISEKAYTALAEAGLNHILAVSGMHCGFLMALVGLLLQSRKRILAKSLMYPSVLLQSLIPNGCHIRFFVCKMLHRMPFKKLNSLLACPLIVFFLFLHSEKLVDNLKKSLVFLIDGFHTDKKLLLPFKLGVHEKLPPLPYGRLFFIKPQ